MNAVHSIGCSFSSIPSVSLYRWRRYSPSWLHCGLTLKAKAIGGKSLHVEAGLGHQRPSGLDVFGRPAALVAADDAIGHQGVGRRADALQDVAQDALALDHQAERGERGRPEDAAAVVDDQEKRAGLPSCGRWAGRWRRRGCARRQPAGSRSSRSRRRRGHRSRRSQRLARAVVGKIGGGGEGIRRSAFGWVVAVQDDLLVVGPLDEPERAVADDVLGRVQRSPNRSSASFLRARGHERGQPRGSGPAARPGSPPASSGHARSRRAGPGRAARCGFGRRS